MSFSLSRFIGLRLLALALVVSCTGELLAQTQNRPRTTQNTTRPTGNVRTGATQAGGGGGGGSSAGANRQYVNSTMIGDALITSDLETRRLIVVTDEETNENIRTIVQSLDKPKP